MENQDSVNTYIVRIYRLAGDKARCILGTTEKAGEREKKAFTTYDELWEILTRRAEGNNDKGGSMLKNA